MKSITLAALGSLLAGSAHAAVLAGWTFETNTVTPVTDSAAGPVIAAEIGSGSFSGLHASIQSDWASANGNGSDSSYSGGTWTTGDYYEFSTSSVGHEGITITFDSIGHGAGAPRDFQLSYSTDGTNFTLFGSVYALELNAPSNVLWTTGTPVTETTYSFDLSGIGELDDSATIYFRVSQVGTTSVSGGTVGAGNVRIDNVTINGTAVPEPSAALLGALGVLGLLRRRR